MIWQNILKKALDKKSRLVNGPIDFLLHLIIIRYKFQEI